MDHAWSVLHHSLLFVLSAVLVACGGGGNLVSSRLPTNVVVTLNPTVVQTGQNATGTVTISSPAPTGGFTVLLSSDNPAVTPPTSVVIPAGATSTTFALSTNSVTVQTSANISAMIPGVSGTNLAATLTVDPTTTAQLQSLQLDVPTVKGGLPITGTVLLTQPPANPASVTLTSSNSAVVAFPAPGGGPSVNPSSVEITAGTTQAQFQINTFPVTVSTVVTITATLNNTVIAMVTVTP